MMGYSPTEEVWYEPRDYAAILSQQDYDPRETGPQSEPRTAPARTLPAYPPPVRLHDY